MAGIQHRSTLGIVRDILQIIMEVGKEGLIVSKIATSANLSYQTTVSNCQKLIEAGLVQSIRIKRNYIFKITEEGVKFVHEVQKFQAVASELNIRY